MLYNLPVHLQSWIWSILFSHLGYYKAPHATVVPAHRKRFEREPVLWLCWAK